MSHVKPSGSWKGLVPGTAVKPAGTWKDVLEIWQNIAGVWKLGWVNFSISANETAVSGDDSGFAACGDPGSTNIVTVTPSGGTAPYTYAWARVGGAADSGPYQANAPTSAATSFSDVNSSVCDADVNSTETWRCTVTDDDTNELTVDVEVTLIWLDMN